MRMSFYEYERGYQSDDKRQHHKCGAAEAGTKPCDVLRITLNNVLELFWH